MRTARLVLTPWLCRNSMISRTCFASLHAWAIRSRRLGPIPSTDSSSDGRVLITERTSAPKRPTSFLARIGPIPFTSPLPRYLSIPSAVVGGTAFSVVPLNCRPCSLSLTHQPSAASHSPAVADGREPTTVTSSSCPFAFHLQDAEAALVAVEGDALDQSGNLLGRRLAFRACGIHCATAGAFQTQ